MRGADHPTFGLRLRAALLVILVAFGALGLRLWFLQVLRGTYFRDLSENNRTRTVRTLAPRGNIFDREGRTLVRNRPAFDIGLILEDVEEEKPVLERLAKLSERTEEELKSALENRNRRYAFEPQVLISDASREELARIKVQGFELPGVVVKVTPRRAYPHGPAAAHLLGYPREITADQLRLQRYRDYRRGDILGQTGLERSWEEELRGENGYVRVEVDARGKRRRELGIRDDRSGNDIYLTIDLDLQLVAHEALKGEEGAVVALDPRNGEVLVLASSPSFDANLFATEISIRDWRSLQNNPQEPLTHRAIAGGYSPGSTFKLMMALAGLMEGVVTPKTTINCPGFYKFGGRRYHCHKRSGHGLVNLRRAVTVSCNTYFYQLGQQLGIERIHEYATKLGLGKSTGIKIPGERGGIVPSEKWKQSYFGQRWYPGETLSVSIGQGALTVTPLQLAHALATLVSGGKRFEPQMVKRIVDKNMGTKSELEAKLLEEVELDPAAVEFVKRAAQSVVEDKEGTGKRAGVEGATVGGKTGTTQIRALGKESDKKEFKDHAWFVAFSPVEEPEIVVAVLVEHGESGGRAAAPVAQKIIEEFHRKKREPIFGPNLPSQQAAQVSNPAIPTEVSG